MFCLQYVCVPCVFSAHEGQKRVVDPLELEFTLCRESPYGCWKLGPGPLQDQQVLLPAKPSLWSHCLVQAWSKLHKRRTIIIPILQNSGVKGLKLRVSAVGIIYLTSFDFMKIVSCLSLLSSSNFLSCRAVLLGMVFRVRVYFSSRILWLYDFGEALGTIFHPFHHHSFA